MHLINGWFHPAIALQKPLSCYRDILLNVLTIQEDLSYLITMTANAHEKVIWLDISVDEVLCVYIFNPADHLKRGEKVYK